MPSRRRCLGPGPFHLTEPGESRCAAHKLKAFANAKPRPDLQTATWRKLSKRRREMYPTCEVPGCYRRSTSVDHIIRPAHGGTDAWSNLRAICAFHHGRKTAHEVHEGRRVTDQASDVR